MKLFLTIASAILFQSLAWAGPVSSGGGGVSGPIKVIPYACAVLSGSNFVSENFYNVGLGAQGPEMGALGLSFSKDGHFSMQVGDSNITGEYTCESAEAIIAFRHDTGNGVETIKGSYNAKASVLFVNGKWYDLKL